MISKKFIFTAAFSVFLLTGSFALADTNDLLKMDIKKSSADDILNVTFYTTGNPTNTVVTRKGGNSYVVLLPNVAGNQSIVPSLGGVKDLVTDINVKNVNDGIGGYTKVTFNTTKPIKIHTNTQKTAPLTKAQKDYKNLIAQNSKFDPDKKMENFKKVSTTNIVKVSNTQKTESKPKLTQNEAPKEKKSAEKVIPQIKQNIVKENSILNNNKTQNSAPKMEQKPNKQENEKTNILTPVSTVKPTFELVNPPQESLSSQPQKTKNVKKKVKTKTQKKGLPIIPIAGICSIIGIFLLGIIINVVVKAIGNNSNKLKEYLENYNSEGEKTNNADYQSILEKEDLTWQEKYKLYSQAKDQQNASEKQDSYIANMSGSKGVILSDDIKTRVSQMEHALSQTPSMQKPETKLHKVKSEEDAIARRMSGLNLKTFAKNVDLKKTNRKNIKTENDNVTTNPLREGKFVNLDNSELTMSQRNIGGHGFSISDLVRTGRRFLNKKQQISEILNKQQEEYLISSLEDYLKLVESEEMAQKETDTDNISNLIKNRSRSEMMSTTNPLMKAELENTQSENTDDKNIVVRAKYEIDNDRSILMVETDGKTSLIGKIGENISVLKKFDKIVNKPLQVRLDYGSIYIVKVGGFKCLVDVAENKMGTLLEI